MFCEPFSRPCPYNSADWIANLLPSLSIRKKGYTKLVALYIKGLKKTVPSSDSEVNNVYLQGRVREEEQAGKRQRRREGHH